MSFEEKLAEFKVSQDYGFLVVHPLTELPEQFAAWKEICGLF